MNFSSHQNNLIENIERALTKSKFSLVNDFKLVLNQAKSLFKSNELDFWINTLENAEVEQLPITKYGHHEAVAASKWLTKEDQNRVKNRILFICESLFTYSHEDENCELQSNFHFYYSISEDCIFKESELGILEGIQNIEKGEFRTAFVSELNIKELELYD